MGRIRVLTEETARQIAAGEVIDRPYSIIRELLDNAIDAGARAVRVEIVKGGLERIRVIDDGAGMDEEDLRLCTVRHATSKIAHHEDLTRVRTLGFRGEALASIGACSALSITSRRPDRPAAHRAAVRFGRTGPVAPSAGVPGTTVDVSSLFFELPARRRFLKSRGAETALCRRTLIEKALPHAEVGFEFAVDGRTALRLPAASPVDRAAAAAGLDAADFTCLRGGGDGVQVTAVAARPERARRDRTGIHVYLNRRRIHDFGLSQAVEYGYGEFLPGGQHPVAFLFVEIDPELVDFNVHPAKREARLRRPGDLHRAISSTLQREVRRWRSPADGGAPDADFYRNRTGAPRRAVLAEAPPAASGAASAHAASAPAGSAHAGHMDVAAGDAAPTLPDVAPALPPLAPRRAAAAPAAPEGDPPPRAAAGTAPGAWRGRAPDADARVRYLGQAFQLFLVAEVGDRLYFVDQHAAHERVLYERLRAGAIDRQQLIAGPTVELSPEQETELRGFLPDLERCGFRLQAETGGRYRITEIPAAAARLPADHLCRFVRLCAGTPEDWDRDVYSGLACRLAIKEGEVIDDRSGQRLLERSFRIDPQRCPHGRPLWFEISRAALEGSVGRPAR